MCIKPLNLTDRTVKCGQCKECLTQRSREWAYRIAEEAKYHDTAYFVTLTYAEEHVPWIDTIHDDKPYTVTTLVKKDMQSFMKRLREHQGRRTKTKLRVFYTGEYGSKTRRAHYHAVIFGLHPSLTSYDFRITQKGQQDPKLAKIWQKGYVKTGRVEGASIRYVTNYMMNKNIDVIGEQEKPFLECSQGLGRDYINTYAEQHWEHGNHKMVMGKPAEFRPNLPRYLMERIFDEDQRKVINDIKREEAEELLKQNFGEAEEKDPLDPIGYVRKAKISKQEAKERFQKFLNKNQI